MAALAAKFLANPRARQAAAKFGKRAAQATFKAWGNSRRRRQARGKWYFGRRIARRRPRMYRAMSGMGKSVVQALPVAVASTTAAAVQAQSTEVTKTELKIPVISAQNSDTDALRITRFPIYSTSPWVCQAGALTSESFQFYRFKWLRWKYVASTSTQKEGNVSVVFVSNKSAADKVLDLSSAELAGAITCSAYSSEASNHLVLPSKLNTQFPRFVVKNNSEVDTSDSQEVQGWMVLVRSNGANSTDEWGTLEVSYCVGFENPGPLEKGVTSHFEHVKYLGAAVADWMTPGLAARGGEVYTHSLLTFENMDAGSGSLQFEIHHQTPSPYVLSIHQSGTTSGGGPGIVGCQFPVTTQGTVTQLHAAEYFPLSAGTSHWYVALIQPKVMDAVLLINCAGGEITVADLTATFVRQTEMLPISEMFP